MNRILTVAGVVLIATALAACSPGIHTLGNSITFDSNGLVVHASGHPDAHVSRDGDLRIGDKAVAVTPAQRQLLQRYFREAADTMASGKTVGKQGVKIATHGIGAAIRSIFQGDSSAADRQLDAQSKQIEAAADRICADVNALGATQEAIAEQIPAFKPYGASNQLKCKVTRTTSYTTAGKVISTSRSYSMQAGKASDGSTPHEPPRPTGKADEPRTPTSSQP